MASFKQYTASGGASEAFSIPTFSSDEIKVYVDNVLKTAATHYNITSYTANGGTVTWTGGNVPSSGTVRIVRDTTVTTAKATYAAGSSIKAGDLNDNQTQALRSLEEQDDQLIQTYDVQDAAVTTAKIKADNITSALIADDQINSEHYVDGSIDTAHIADSQITSAKIADGTIVNADISGSAAITGSKIVASTTSVAGTMSAADKTKLDGIEASATADQSNAEIRAAVEAASDSNVFTDADHSKLNAIEASATADQTNAEIRTAVEAATDSNVFTDADHSKLNAIEASATADQSNAEIRAAVEAASDSNVFTDADHSKLNAIEASATADQTASEIKSLIASSPLDASHLAADSVTTSEIADAELTTLAGMQTGTASILAGGTALTATLAEINTVVDGKSVETTISDTDAAYPTSGAVVDYVAAQIAPIGGLEVIATDAAFPNTQPAAGVVISIADAGGLVVNGSGTSTTGRTVGASTVTINNIASNFNSTTVDAGVSFMVSSTGSGQIYNYHKATLKEADLLSLSGDINDFAERYRVAGSAPSSSLDEGDLWWDTATDKLKVYDGSSWEEVASSGDFYINTISSYSGTGGNSASFNGSAYRFTLSNPGSTAQQHVVSINGVIQKPNSGTSQPSEGFVIDGSSIIFSNAPTTGSDYFILTLGSTVSIGTPSDNTVSTAKIQNLAVTTAKIAADAVDGTKIADDAVGAEHIEVLDAALQFGDSVKAQFGAGNDLEIFHDGSHSKIKQVGTGNLNVYADTFKIVDNSNGDNMINANRDGAVELYYDNSKKFETTSAGVSTTGTSLHTDNIKITVDNGALWLGAGDDLGLYHDGTNNILSSLAPDLYIKTTGSETCARFGRNGGVDLYYDNAKTFETKAHGIQITGGEGASADILFYADEGDDDADKWYQYAATNGEMVFRNYASGAWEDSLKLIANGAAELYYDNAKCLETRSDGVSITNNGSETFRFTGHILSGVSDSSQLYLGQNDDLQMYHNGSHGHLKNTTGDFYIAGDAVKLTNGAISEDLLIASANGSVELRYDNSNKFNTDPDGVQVTGTIQAHRNISDSDYTSHAYHVFQHDLNDVALAVFEHSGDSTPYGLYIDFSDASPDGNTRYFLECVDSTATRMKIYSDGDVWTSDSGTLSSDETLKENIVDATPKLEDLKKLKVRNFNWKSSFHPEKSKQKQLGFIAQEVEEVFPSLVSEHDISPALPGDGHVPVMKKAIKQAWDPIIIKAMQELIAKIETLETKVAALEAK